MNTTQEGNKLFFNLQLEDKILIYF